MNEKKYMEKHKEISPLQEWINTDKKLSAILVEIQELPISVEEQAELAFHRVSEAYNIPKTPQDIDFENEDDDEEPTSVYQHPILPKKLTWYRLLVAIFLLQLFNF